MGLDMYLEKRTYVKNWDHTEKKYKVSLTKDGKKVMAVKPERISYIIEEVGYWRKANQIHNWFTQNCADGDVEKDTMCVQDYELEELLKAVNTVLKASKLIDGKISNGQRYEDGKWVDIMVDGKTIEDPTVAKDLLPTASGFFFGGTNYDEYYIEDLKHTKEILEKILKEDSEGYADYYYNASW